MDHSLPGSSVHRIFQARILQWVAISSSRGSPDPEIEPESPVSPALKANSLLLSHQEWEEAPCLELFLCVEVVVSFFKI